MHVVSTLSSRLHFTKLCVFFYSVTYGEGIALVASHGQGCEGYEGLFQSLEKTGKITGLKTNLQTFSLHGLQSRRARRQA